MKYLELYLVVLIHLGTIPAVGYPVAWALRGTFRASKVGRALMFKAVSLASLFVTTVLGVWFDHPQWWYWLYTAVVTFVTVALWRQFLVLLVVLREYGRDHG